MGMLAGTLYDPAGAVSKDCSAALAMTALDTTNLRLTFTAPLNGAVRVRMRTVTTGATTAPAIMLGILDGATVRLRQAPVVQRGQSTANGQLVNISEAVIAGLTAGNSYTWDASYGVETGVASSNIKYGGPNNTTTNDAFGGFLFEVHDTPGLLGQVLYDPASAASKAVSSLLAMTAFDTTNARITFNAPASGNVAVILRTAQHGGTVFGVVILGVLDGATVRGRVRAFCGSPTNTLAATDLMPVWMRSLVTGLTPGTSYTWDAAYGVEVTEASTNLVYGGPNDTTADNAFGALSYEIWDAGSVPFAVGSVV